jgi:hypothetical protein
VRKLDAVLDCLPEGGEVNFDHRIFIKVNGKLVRMVQRKLQTIADRFQNAIDCAYQTYGDLGVPGRSRAFQTPISVVNSLSAFNPDELRLDESGDTGRERCGADTEKMYIRKETKSQGKLN